ncbi:hypothetical protein WJX72_005114 [[Myrmecia] bisecta]|uniref:TIR domain-containing protein n=1 Tax=[Myrmecia] bisecta TaxID=41462 RepID=A0AAW1QR70_9CHLO
MGADLVASEVESIRRLINMHIHDLDFQGVLRAWQLLPVDIVPSLPAESAEPGQAEQRVITDLPRSSLLAPFNVMACTAWWRVEYPGVKLDLPDRLQAASSTTSSRQTVGAYSAVGCSRCVISEAAGLPPRKCQTGGGPLIFICHAERDPADVPARLGKALLDAGFSPFILGNHVPAESAKAPVVTRTIVQCRGGLVLLSEDLMSDSIRAEIVHGLVTNRMQNRMQLLLPVFLTLTKREAQCKTAQLGLQIQECFDTLLSYGGVLHKDEGEPGDPTVDQTTATLARLIVDKVRQHVAMA